MLAHSVCPDLKLLPGWRGMMVRLINLNALTLQAKPVPRIFQRLLVKPGTFC